MNEHTIRVLLIDDNLTDRELIKDALLQESSGFRITEAKTKEEFFNALKAGLYDVVLSDFNILGFEGIETIEAVKSIDPDLPVIIVTGTGSEEIAVQCLKIGAADYILKTRHDIIRLPHTINSVLEKAKLEEKRKQNIAKLTFQAHLLRNVSDAIISTDNDFSITSWNDSAEIMYGWKEKEALGKNIQSLICTTSPEDEALMRIAILKKDGLWRGEVSQKHKNGEKLTVEASITTLRADNDQITGYVYVNRDISKRKMVYLLLNTREQLIQFAIDHSIAEIMQKTFDDVENLTESKTGFFHLIDDQENTLLLETWSTSTREIIEKAKAKGSHYTSNKDGIWADCIRQRKAIICNDCGSMQNYKRLPEGYPELNRELVVPIFRQDRIVAVIGVGNKETRYTEQDVDMTTYLADVAWAEISRKRALEDLKISEENYRTVVENQTEMINKWLPDGTITFVNEAYSRFYNLPAERILGQKWYQVARGMQVEQVESYFQEILSSINPSNPFMMSEHTEEAADGSVHWVNWVDRGIFDEEGNLLEVQAVGRDITQRKQAEEALRASEDKFKYVFDYSIIGKSITYPSGEMQVNQAFCDMLGYSKEELEQNKWQEITHPDDIKLSEDMISRLMSGERDSTRFVKRYLHKDGSIVWTDLSTTIRRDSENHPLYLITAILDITEQIQQKEELNHRLFDMALLNEAAVQMSTCVSPDEICKTAIDFMQKHPGWVNVSIILTKEDGRKLDYIESNAQRYVGRLQTIFEKNPHDLLIGSILESAFEKKKTLRCADFDNEPSYEGLIKTMRSGMYTPLMRGGESIGMICIENEEANAFDQHSEELISIFAEIISNLLQKITLILETEKQLNRIETLRMIDQAITSSTDLGMVVDVFLDQCIRQLNVDSVSIFNFNPNTYDLELVKQKDTIDLPESNEIINIGESALGSVVRKRVLLHISDLSAENSERMKKLLRKGVEDYYALPLITKGEIKGVMEVYNRSRINPDKEWLSFLNILSNQAAIAIENVKLYDNLQKNNLELLMAYDETLEGWSKALDLRDSETEGHTRRVVDLSLKLAKALDISESDYLQIRRGALLHDIGKIGVPDDILRKPGKLTDDEWEIMRKHPEYAFAIISPIEYLRSALDIPYCHHEKWDGTGYPRGLKEREIPLTARLFAVIDVFDALISDRPYRKAWTKERAIEYIRTESGTHFDPEVVTTFLAMMENEKDSY